MINQSVVFGQFKGRVLPADGLIYTACLSVSDFIVVMFHTENIANCDTGGNRDAEHTSLYHTFGG